MRRTSRRIRRNSRRRTSLRRNTRASYVTQAQKLAELLKSKYNVEYSEFNDSGMIGSAADQREGQVITFRGSANDGNVWVMLPAMSFKTDYKDAFRMIKKFKKFRSEI